jgi:hypothetical protein
MNPYLNTRLFGGSCPPYTTHGPNVKGVQFDSGSQGWSVQANYVARISRMFQFNTHYLADEPRDGPYFGAAVWPVSISYRCDNFQVCTTCSGGTCGAGGPPCYTFFGMWWPEQAGNRWHRPADINLPANYLENPWAPWDQCWGHPAMPVNNGQNVQITSWAPDSFAAAIAAAAGPESPFGNWMTDTKRIDRNYPAAPCGGSDGPLAPEYLF